ncbi:DUF2533 family protein [Anaerobacillus isosaccharinicus]|uniref:DUF2533 family protein n=1 Tax=Anaerobacillus isosaccharinicus TaxID=1532552 RepID=A0A1S2LR85_9BACI|nr:DUF2533 family protein [Anaerobacillus isosaccharinicus]MBA5585471.1 DUF2533 family protein [Anaerobacillus isosaccharinicus]QOY36212.1 DUF2533 family protein [Anaerobacillus isosaccharinicus]
MSVHLQLKKQMTNFIAAEKKYKELDKRREEKIEEVIKEARANKDFSLNEVNALTEELNNLRRSFGFLPMRKTVTKEMVFDYINRD